MSLISFSPLQDGVTGVNAAATNTPLSTIYNDYNGNITDANIAAGAAIAGSKVNMASLANPYKFSVYRNGAATQSASLTKVNFDTKLFDTGSNFDIVTNFRFTAPIAGFYHFNSTVSFTPTTGTGYQIALYKNGAIARQGSSFIVAATSGFVDSLIVSAQIQLAATDYVEAFFLGKAGDAIVTAAQFTAFDGFLISAT